MQWETNGIEIESSDNQLLQHKIQNNMSQLQQPVAVSNNSDSPQLAIPLATIDASITSAAAAAAHTAPVNSLLMKLLALSSSTASPPLCIATSYKLQATSYKLLRLLPMK
jgi:hypothetical protein